MSEVLILLSEVAYAYCSKVYNNNLSLKRILFILFKSLFNISGR